MSDSTASLRRKIASAGTLHSVVRTMKALASSSIGQYERALLALADYDHAVALGLGTCFRAAKTAPPTDEVRPAADNARLGAIVFGSDQGLVGRFNDVIADHAIAALAALPGEPQVWAVGERVHARLKEAGLRMVGLLAVPMSVNAIAPLVGQLQVDSEADRTQHAYSRILVFHNRPLAGSFYEPASQRLLPLDAAWQRGLADLRWPGAVRPEVLGSEVPTLRGLIREYLFISLFRACAESLASENASRLAAMQRADKSIEDLQDNLHSAFARQRQGAIDDELFDVTSGYEALTSSALPGH